VTWIGGAAIALGMAMVRRGWSGQRALALAGWLLAGIGLALLAWQDGAWGAAMGTLVGTGVALGCVLYAGMTAPAKIPRPERTPATMALPWRWGDLGRRSAVFLLVVPIGFAAAQWAAFGMQAMARRAGVGETDAVVLTLLLQPVAWVAIMSIQMTRHDLRRMIGAPVAAALFGTLLWGLA